MRTTLSQQKFLDSDAAHEIRAELIRMEADSAYNTQPMYSASMVDAKSFVAKHMDYLCERPKLDPHQYLSNLRLMTRIKQSV